MLCPCTSYLQVWTTSMASSAIASPFRLCVSQHVSRVICVLTTPTSSKILSQKLAVNQTALPAWNTALALWLYAINAGPHMQHLLPSRVQCWKRSIRHQPFVYQCHHCKKKMELEVHLTNIRSRIKPDTWEHLQAFVLFRNQHA